MATLDSRVSLVSVLASGMAAWHKVINLIGGEQLFHILVSASDSVVAHRANMWRPMKCLLRLLAT